MGWSSIASVAPPVGRPVLIRTAESAEPTIAFLGSDGVWYEGGALVQTAGTILGATPTEWVEPDGEGGL